MVAEVAPAVEAAAQRDFLDLPAVDPYRRADLKAHLRARYEQMRGYAGDPNALGAQEAAAMAQAEQAAAVYVPFDHAIYFVTDAVVDDALPLRCVLAHELTHVLQHQYAPEPEDDPEQVTALREGHANYIMLEVCKELPRQQLANPLTRTDVLASRTPSDPLSYAYGYGERFIAAVAAAGGAEAVWWTLAQPPPDQATLLQIAQGMLPSGWDNAKLWDVPGATPIIERDIASPIDVLPIITMEPIPLDMPAFAWGGRLAVSEDGALWVAIALEGEARAWVAWRRAQMELIRRPVRPVRALRGSPEVDDSLEIRRRRQRERWVAADGLLLISLTSAERDKVAPLRAILDLHLPTRPPEQPDVSLVQAMLPAQFPPLVESWQYRLSLATAAAGAGDYGRCVAQSFAALEVGGPPHPAAEQAYRCALLAQDLDAAHRANVALRPAPAPADLRYEHSRQLAARARYDEALALLDAPAETPEDQQHLRDIQLWIFIRTHQTAQVIQLARSGTPSAVMRLEAAIYLTRQRHAAIARELLAPLCDELAGSDQDRCKALQIVLGSITP